MLEICNHSICSIQDLGRYGYRSYGVPLSGAMDMTSAKQANVLLGNEATMAVLEVIVLQTIVLKFHQPTLIAITGAPTKLFVDNEETSMYKPIAIASNTVIKLQPPTQGNYTYIGIKGGILSETVLGSRSHYPNITTPIGKGSMLPYQPYSASKEAYFVRLKTKIPSHKLRVIEGPEYHLLDQGQQHFLKASSFELSSQSNRMGFRLTGFMQHNLPSIWTSPVQPGTVQLTPSGMMIVLMRDAQTTGGYPRILQLSEEAINQLAQTLFGNEIRFISFRNSNVFE